MSASSLSLVMSYIHYVSLYGLKTSNNQISKNWLFAEVSYKMFIIFIIISSPVSCAYKFAD